MDGGRDFYQQRSSSDSHGNQSNGFHVETGQDALICEQLQERIRVLESELLTKDAAIEKSNQCLKEAAKFAKEFIVKCEQKTSRTPAHDKPEATGDIKEQTDEHHFDSQPKEENNQDIIILGLKKKLKEQESVLKDCTDEYMKRIEKVTEDRSKYQHLNTDLNARIQTLEATLQKHHSKSDGGRLLQELEYNKRKVGELMEKLSHEWSQKISSNESELENISIKHRPMNIVTDYNTLTSLEWLDAKNGMDVCSAENEEGKLRVLCETLLDAEKLARRKYYEIMNNFPHNLILPLSTVYISEFSATTETPTQKEDGETSGPTTAETKNDAFLDHGQQPGEHIDMDTDSGNQQATDGEQGNSGSSDAQANYPHDRSRLDELANTIPSNQFIQKELSTSNPVGKSAPIHCVKQIRHVSVTGETELLPITIPEHLQLTLTNTLGDVLRLNADDVTLSSLEMSVYHFMTNRLSECQPPLSCQDELLRKYVNACCRLCWKMAIQRPAMSFSCEGVGQKWDSKTQEAYFGAVDPDMTGAIVSYYVKPTLMHGEKLMVKGNIMTQLDPLLTGK